LAAFDLDNMSIKELEALRDAAEAKRLEKIQAAADEVLTEAKAKLAGLGLPQLNNRGECWAKAVDAKP